MALNGNLAPPSTSSCVPLSKSLSFSGLTSATIHEDAEACLYCIAVKMKGETAGHEPYNWRVTAKRWS